MVTSKSTLFIPPIDPESVIWSGLPISEEALTLYDVDEVQTTNEVNAHLAAPSKSKHTVFAIANQVSDHITFLEFENKDFTILKEAIEESRVVKDSYEIGLIQKANEISTIAHTAVLKAVKHATNERELEGLFIEKCIANGAREQAYHSIVASGTAAATLHYVKNYEPLEGKLNLLLDAGGEVDCYASDIVSWREVLFRKGTTGSFWTTKMSKSLKVLNSIEDSQWAFNDRRYPMFLPNSFSAFQPFNASSQNPD